MLPSLEEAIAAIKAGDKAKGRNLLADILQADLENETAWLWMSSVATSDEERRRYLKRVLEINPDNKAAQRGLAKLASKRSAAPTDKAAPPDEEPGPAVPPPPPAPAQDETPPEPLEPEADMPPPPAEKGPEEAAAKPLPVPPPPAPPSTADDVVAQFRTGSPAADDLSTQPGPDVPDDDDDEIDDDAADATTGPKGDGVINFLNSERGIFALIAAAVMMVLALVACVVLNLVFQPLAQQISPTVAAALGTDTPTATFTPVTPSATPTPSSTPTPTVTPTLTPSPLSTQVVASTATVTPTPSRTATPDLSQQPAEVIDIASGDTVTVLLNGQEERVKYLSIDAPAVNEPIGQEALETNRILVEGKTVVLEKDRSDRDEQGRLLRYVFVDDLMVNEILLQQGAARLSLTPPDTKYGARLQDAEQSARDQGFGVWGLE